MLWQTVTSSAVTHVGYDLERQIAGIAFTGGEIYHYYNVPVEEIETILSAESIGTYVNTIFKKKYSNYRKVDHM